LCLHQTIEPVPALGRLRLTRFAMYEAGRHTLEQADNSNLSSILQTARRSPPIPNRFLARRRDHNRLNEPMAGHRSWATGITLRIHLGMILTTGIGFAWGIFNFSSARKTRPGLAVFPWRVSAGKPHPKLDLAGPATFSSGASPATYVPGIAASTGRPLENPCKRELTRRGAWRCVATLSCSDSRSGGLSPAPASDTRMKPIHPPVQYSSTSFARANRTRL